MRCRRDGFRASVQLGAEVVAIAQLLEKGGKSLEDGGVGKQGIVARGGLRLSDGVRHGEGRRLAQLKPRQAEVGDDGVEGHLRGAPFALAGVASDVGRGYGGPGEQREGYVRLVFPAVYDGSADKTAVEGFYDCGSVHHRTAGGVDDDGTAAQGGEEGFVGHVKGGIRAGMGQRCVEGDGVGLAGYLGECVPSGTSLGALPRRVAAQHAHAQRARPALHYDAYVAHAHDAEGEVAQRARGNGGEAAEDILTDGRRVAARRVGYLDAAGGTPWQVDMVGADGGGGYHGTAGGAEEGLVRARARTYDNGVDIAHRVGGDVGRGGVDDAATGFEHAADERDIALYKEFQARMLHTERIM